MTSRCLSRISAPSLDAQATVPSHSPALKMRSKPPCPRFFLPARLTRAWRRILAAGILLTFPYTLIARQPCGRVLAYPQRRQLSVSYGRL